MRRNGPEHRSCSRSSNEAIRTPNCPGKRLPWELLSPAREQFCSICCGRNGIPVLRYCSPWWRRSQRALPAPCCASLCRGFARFFLEAHRAEVEVRQYAQSLFLSREVFATRGRTGVLLLVSMFERQVVLLPDTGLAKRLSREAMHHIVARMTAALAGGQVRLALENGASGIGGAPRCHGSRSSPGE